MGRGLGLNQAMVCWTAGRYLPEGTSPKKNLQESIGAAAKGHGIYPQIIYQTTEYFS
jgi:hypothetical protein